MPQTTTKHSRAAKTPETPRSDSVAAHPATVIDRTRELSEAVLESVEAAQRAAIEAVRNFVDTVDRALPGHGEGQSRRQEVVDSAMQMADRLVHTQYDFIRKVIEDAGNALSKPKG